MHWAQEAAGARIVAPLPLESQWLANHLLVLGDGRELVLRRWARPGWEGDDPDLTAAREVLVLERLAGTPRAGPQLGAGHPPTGRPATPPPCSSRACPGRSTKAGRRSGRSSPRWPRST